MRYILAIALLAVALPAFAGTATLTWTDNATNELGYEVERKSGLCAATGTWAKLGEVGANIKTYVDATPVVGNAYSFRVRAWNNSMLDGSGVKQYSGYTNCAEIAYPLAPPADPSQLGVTAGP